MKRVTISKKTRFNIFARDSFSCQYCGRTPPAVILHLDHVIPLAEGGTDDPDNLITACKECNLGKGTKLLSIAPKGTGISDRISELKEQEAQLAAYRKFLEKNRQRQESEIEEIADYWSRLFDNQKELTLTGKLKFQNWLTIFPLPRIIEAMNIARAKIISPEDHIKYTHGILRNWKLAQENPERANIEKNISTAAKFWQNMTRGTGYLPNNHRSLLKDLLNVCDLEEVIEGMKSWGSAIYFTDFIDSMLEKYKENK